MRVMYDNFSETIGDGTFIALGSFDGLHKGHRAILDLLKEKARKNNCKSMVYTFVDHPLRTIRPEKAPKLLTTVDEKIEILEGLQIDIVNFVTFNKEYMEIAAEDFVKKLVENYNMKGIIVGFNNRFGHKNSGDVNLLKRMSAELGFKVYVMDPVLEQEEVISSTLIREDIASGNVFKVKEEMKRFYSMKGIVVHGRALGRTIGFPTANIATNPNKIMPKGGVYYTNVRYNDEIYKGITNVGYNPTVNGNTLTVETYILDFDRFIYEEEITVYFIKRIRDEVKLSSVEELKEQIQKDCDFAKKEILYSDF